MKKRDLCSHWLDRLYHVRHHGPSVGTGGGARPIETFYTANSGRIFGQNGSVQNPAPADHLILPELQQRWSPVIFSAAPVPDETLTRLFEAARWAPSSSNEQPWSFVVATAAEPDLFAKFAACLAPGNAWAKTAPVLALSVVRLHLSGEAKPNRYGFHDTGMAVGNLLAQATAEGLFVHQMGGFDVEKARKDLRVPEGHDPGAMIAIGYYGDPDRAQAGLRDRELLPRTRKPLDEFVFRGTWGKR